MTSQVPSSAIIPAEVIVSITELDHLELLETASPPSPAPSCFYVK